MSSAVYSWRVLRAGTFRLDGGAMFGLIPRVVWSRHIDTDDRGRIAVQHNCLLLERSGAAGPGETGPKHILIEVGTGEKMDAKNREIFDLDGRWIINALDEVDCRCEEIGAVVVSHLHFDHAGALTRLCRRGESGDWQASPGTGPVETLDPVKLTFPNAAVFTQRREWEDALANRSVMTRTYFRDHLDPIREHVRLVDSPPPFPLGTTQDRDQLPAASLAERSTEILPGIFVFNTPGHTWGQQAVLFRDTRGRTVVFTPDVMPTAAHIGAAYNLAYDVEPYTSMITRQWFLTEAAAADWLLVLDHEPGPSPCRRVRPDGRGWFQLMLADEEGCEG
jgi:glyoxylase-like metal-dependent hydrolase (beta-lactamase superfamily II)